MLKREYAMEILSLISDFSDRFSLDEMRKLVNFE